MNIKISALPTATAIGTSDNHVIVQSGVTKKIANSILKTDILNSVSAGASIYTASGNVFNDGVATTRIFSFTTDQDGTYNPSGYKSQLLFNGYFTTVGGFSTQPGTFGLKVNRTATNKLAAINMYPIDPEVEIFAVDTTVGNVRKLSVTSDSLELSTTFASGFISLTFDNNGLSIIDSRASKFGLEYGGDYSLQLSTHDRSVTDVGTVKILRQQSNTWTTAGRPTPAQGVFGFNTDTSKFEGYDGTTWVDFH